MITDHKHKMNVRVGFIKENFLAINTFKLSFDFNKFIIPNKEIMNNKLKSKECNVKMRKKRLKTRTKEELIFEIQNLSKIDKRHLNYSYLRSIKRHDLLFDAVEIFGGWRKTVEAAGFRPIQKGWNKEEIIDELLKIHKKLGYVPKRDLLRKIKRNDLERAAVRHFGSWNKAIIAANLKPNKITNWTKDSSINELKKFSKRLGHSPSMRELKDYNKSSLLRAGLKFFGKYNNFLQTAGLDLVLDMNKWPKSKIIKELQKMYDILGRTPRKTELAVMKKHDLINAAETYFPCWSEALITAGLVPNSDILGDNKSWRDWENLIFELLSKRRIDYGKKKYIKKIGYPDVYIPSEDKIIEIKLNCSENSVKKDIEKYLPYCKSLEIWYLYGKPKWILSNKVSFVGPNKIKSLIKDKRLLNKFHSISNKLGVKVRDK